MSIYDEQINALDEQFRKKDEELNKQKAKRIEESIIKADAVEIIFQKIIIPHLQSVERSIRDKGKKITIDNKDYKRLEGYDKSLLSKVSIVGGVEKRNCRLTISSDAGSGYIKVEIVLDSGALGVSETHQYLKFTEELMESLCSKFINGYYNGNLN